jgi:hypothetical protein
MNMSAVLEQITTVATREAKDAGKFVDTVFEFAKSAPSNVWAMCAFTAAASIMVTLVTFYLWPKQGASAAPAAERDSAGERTAIGSSGATGPNGVWRLASRGMGAPDIARRTGMSHDAVATILRARTQSRSVPAPRGGKSQPSAA